MPAKIRGRHRAAKGPILGGFWIPLAVAISVLAFGLLWLLGAAHPVTGSTPSTFTTASTATSLGIAGVPASAIPLVAPNAFGPELPPAAANLATPPENPSTPEVAEERTSTAFPRSITGGACGHQLDEPFGFGRKFIVHRVLNSDSIEQYQTTYGTSQASIEAVNSQTVFPLRPDQIIVIPAFQKAIEGLPSFEAFQLNEHNARIPKVASMLGASNVSDFLFYNGYTFTQCPDFVGWVIAPREKVAPTPMLICTPGGQSAVVCPQLKPTPTYEPTHRTP